MRILGVDGGLDGGIAVLNHNSLDYIAPMPTIPAADGKKREYDLPAIRHLIHDMHPEHAFLERAQAMPGQGGVSMFTIGKNYGIMIGIISCRSIPMTIIHPRTWQKRMFSDLAKMDTKAASAIIAQRLFPNYIFKATVKCSKIHDGMTDAACIAAYGAWLFSGPVELSEEDIKCKP